MAHVQISKAPGDSALKVVIDGVDMTDHVYREGFGLVEVGEGVYAEWGIQTIVAADALELDLPDAVLDALVKVDDPEATK